MVRSFLAWVALIVAGFAYVSVALCGRSDPLRSENGGHEDLAILLALAPVAFFLGPRRNLAPRPDESGGAARLRFLGYAALYFAALHFQYVGDAIGAHFSLTAGNLRSLDARSGAALAAGLLLFLGLAAHHLALARRERILLPYAGAFAVIALGIALETWRLRATHYLHIHHFFWGGILAPFCRFRTAGSVAAQAFLLGVCVEGASRWGMDPTWYPLAR